MSVRVHDQTCGRCPLTDCDVFDRRCQLKQAASAYSSIRKRSGVDAIPDGLRQAATAWHSAYRTEVAALESEGQR